MRKLLIKSMLVLFGLAGLVNHSMAASPNIVFILADDLGYGDVHALNPERGKIPTPAMDQLAAAGMVFTDAHTGSSVCTPTRYGILTGRYSWRTRLQKSVLVGYSKPLIAKDRTTVASLLKEQGYNTGAIGKWHLGLDMPTTDGEAVARDGGNVDWKGVIGRGPTQLGFDYYYGISASLDMPPYIYIENDRFDGVCTTKKAFFRKGFAHADFEAIDVLPTIGTKTAEFIAKQTADKPFFAYVALTSPHTPILPSKEWQGKSGLGDYGDFVMQTDAVVRQITKAVDDAGFASNTLIIFTSDNGCSARRAKAKQLEEKGHFVSAHFRGAKSDLWDGGHRVPFIVRWPDRVEPESTSNQLICLTDLMATVADVSGAKVPAAAGEDSVSFVPALRGDPIVSEREGIIHHSIGGNFAYRQGKWKLLLSKGSGGWSSPTEKEATLSEAPIAQLYDMENDPGEKYNLYETKSEVFERLREQLVSDIESGRSTAGAESSNDVDNIKIWKGREPAKAAAKE